MAQRKEIREGQNILILTGDGWKTGKVQTVYRDKHGPIAVMVDGVRYGVSAFKAR